MCITVSSGDSTARLWHVNNNDNSSIVLSHLEGRAQGHVTNDVGSSNNNRDVTSVHWSVSNYDY